MHKCTFIHWLKHKFVHIPCDYHKYHVTFVLFIELYILILLSFINIMSPVVCVWYNFCSAMKLLHNDKVKDYQELSHLNPREGFWSSNLFISWQIFKICQKRERGSTHRTIPWIYLWPSFPAIYCYFFYLFVFCFFFAKKMCFVLGMPYLFRILLSILS